MTTTKKMPMTAAAAAAAAAAGVGGQGRLPSALWRTASRAGTPPAEATCIELGAAVRAYWSKGRKKDIGVRGEKIPVPLLTAFAVQRRSAVLRYIVDLSEKITDLRERYFCSDPSTA
jgi:hypothetical protein